MRPGLVGASILASILLAAGCAPVPADIGHLPRPDATQGAEPPEGNNWPIPPNAAERLLGQAPIELISAKPTEQGVAGAFKAVIRFPPDERTIKAKWKTVPDGDMDGWNNNPRKELAAFAIQRLFLDPKDYVVPTVALRCVPIDIYRRVEPSANPNVPGTTCILGEFSLWIENVKVPESLYDPQRFATDYNYAYHLANMNILSYIIHHRDGRSGNILVADDETNRRAFAIDNGISFGGLVYNYFSTNWHVLRVPGIPRKLVDRLRKIEDEDLEPLQTLAEVRKNDQGVLVFTAPTAAIDPDDGVRITDDRIQMGLTEDEIDDVEERIEEILELVDNGKLPVF